MILAASEDKVDIIKRISDHPWGTAPDALWQVDLFGMKATLMSNSIAIIILVAILLCLVIIPVARHYRHVPKGGRNVLELILVFIRDMVAKPALHDHAYKFMPFLTTLFVFVLGMNMAGMFPIEALSELVAHYVPALHGKPIGGTPTGILAVTGGLAFVTLIMVLTMGMRGAAIRFHHHHPKVPMVAAAVLSPLLWVWSLSPSIPGVTGAILKLPLMAIELSGVFARCFALMIRLFANMISGHTMLAVFLMLMFESLTGYFKAEVAGFPHWTYVSVLTTAASLGIGLMELLVAAIQAYVFTFLTAIFIGLAMEEGH